MKSPTKGQIEEALKFAHEISVQAGQTKPDRPYTYDALDILDAAYRSALEDIAALKLLRAQDYENLVRTNARAELAERQYCELCDWLRTCPDMQTESRVVMVIRHERERKELEA